MKAVAERITTSDGLELRLRAWLPAEPEALLLVIHGLGEHSGRYSTFGRHFAELGYGVYAVDLRGHGESPGLRVHVDSFDDYHRDVACLHGEARRRHGGLLLVLVGHSMGGLITLRHVLHTPTDLAGAVVSSPALAAHPSIVPSRPLRLLAGILRHLAPRVCFPSGIDPKGISRDPRVVEAYRNDPLVSGKVSARWYGSVLDAQADVLARSRSLARPLLLMQSAGDLLVDPEATRRWAASASKEVEFVLWDGLYHEMLNEPEKLEVFARIESWLAGILR